LQRFAVLGWLMGLEPTTTGITILGDNQALARLGGEFVGSIAQTISTCSSIFPDFPSHDLGYLGQASRSPSTFAAQS
jgi:hypothetical protein